MKYATIDELNAGIERLVKRTVKSYYTDWKHYDRPYYMFSSAKGTKHYTLIVRTCGTYLFTDGDMKRNCPKDICEYYREQAKDTSWFYEIDREKLTLKKIKD